MNLQQALDDPSSVFAAPADVVRSEEVSREHKIQILRRWEYEARTLEVAQDENTRAAAGRSERRQAGGRSLPSPGAAGRSELRRAAGRLLPRVAAGWAPPQVGAVEVLPEEVRDDKLTRHWQARPTRKPLPPGRSPAPTEH